MQDVLEKVEEQVVQTEHPGYLVINNAPGKNIADTFAEIVRERTGVIVTQGELETQQFGDGEYGHKLLINPEADKGQNKEIVILVGDHYNTLLSQVEANHIAEKLDTMNRKVHLIFTYFPGARKEKMDEPGDIMTGPQILSILRKIGTDGRIYGVSLHAKVVSYIGKQLKDINEIYSMCVNVGNKIAHHIENNETVNEHRFLKSTRKTMSKIWEAGRKLASDRYHEKFDSKAKKNGVTEDEVETLLTVFDDLQKIIDSDAESEVSSENIQDVKNSTTKIGDTVKKIRELYGVLREKITKSPIKENVDSISLNKLQAKAIREYLLKKYPGIDLKKVVGCGPDYSAYMNMVRDLLKNITGCEDLKQLLFSWIDKYRSTDTKDQTEVMEIHGYKNIPGNFVVMYDDIFGTGGTMGNALLEIKKHNPKGVFLSIDHMHIARKKNTKFYHVMTKIVEWYKGGMVGELKLHNAPVWAESIETLINYGEKEEIEALENGLQNLNNQNDRELVLKKLVNWFEDGMEGHLFLSDAPDWAWDMFDFVSEQKLKTEKEEVYVALQRIIDWYDEGLIQKFFMTDTIDWVKDLCEEVNEMYISKGKEPPFIISQSGEAIADAFLAEKSGATATR